MEKPLFWLNGASSGIGYAVAENLAKQGAALILASRSQEKLEAKKKLLEKLGAYSVETVLFDVSQKMDEGTIETHLKGRKIMGLLLNGGGPRPGPILSFTTEDMASANELLVAGPTRFLLSMLNHMVPHKSSVVAITSSAVKEPVRGLNLSAIYRAAFVVLLKNLSKEIGHMGIRINNVAPGKILTEHLEKLIQGAAQKNNTSVELEKESWEKVSALNRIGSPEEIANVIEFLLTEKSSFVNGQTIFVDGNSTESYF
jgi:3-oxoacyl-[acyl-carrier protein] reductase